MSEKQKKNNTVANSDKSLADSKKTASVEGLDLNEVLDKCKLTERMGKGSVLLTVLEEVDVEMNEDWIDELVSCLLDVAYSYENRVAEELTPEIFAGYLKWVIMNRINYIRNGRNAVHPKDVKYPVVMYDALARICDYEGTTKDGAVLKPRIAKPELTEADKKLFGAESKITSWIDNNRVIDFPDRDKVVRRMEQAGIQMATGLPMEKRNSDRCMFEMDVDVDKAVTTAGTAPSIAQVFARCFYTMSAVEKLVGPQRVELLLYKTLKAELYNICERYVRQMRK